MPEMTEGGRKRRGRGDEVQCVSGNRDQMSAGALLWSVENDLDNEGVDPPRGFDRIPQAGFRMTFTVC